jgi:hypothetical protein
MVVYRARGVYMRRMGCVQKRAKEGKGRGRK